MLTTAEHMLSGIRVVMEKQLPFSGIRVVMKNIQMELGTKHRWNWAGQTLCNQGSCLGLENVFYTSNYGSMELRAAVASSG